MYLKQFYQDFNFHIFRGGVGVDVRFQILGELPQKEG